MPEINIAVSIVQKNSNFYVLCQEIKNGHYSFTLSKVNKYGVNEVNYCFYKIDSLNIFAQKVKEVNKFLYVFGSMQHVNVTGNEYNTKFIFCYDLNLNLIWTKKFGEPYFNNVNDFVFTNDNCFLFYGENKNTPNGRRLLEISKTDSLFNTLWTKRIGKNGRDFFATCVTKNKDSSYLISGYHSNYIGQNTESYFAKIDHNGEILWENNYDMLFGSSCSYITQISDSFAVVIGNIHTSKFPFESKGYYAKVDMFTGEIILLKDYQFKDYTSFLYSKILVHKNNDLVFKANIKDNNELPNINNILLIKMDINGNIKWTREYYKKEDRHQYIYDIQNTDDGGYVLCGSAKDSGYIQRNWVLKVDCNGFDSVTYYAKDSICIPEDCRRYENDFSFTLSKDSVELYKSEGLNCVAQLNENATLTWDFGDQTELKDMLNVYHFYQKPGTYEVSLIFEKGMCQLKKSKQVFVKSPDLIDEFALYPNPNSGQFELLHYFDGEVSMKIMNAIGQEVFVQNNLSPKHSFHFSLRSGIYFVYLTNNGNNYKQKMLVY
ncbi:MAG: T9SS type A sorting domain-containing protein [Flavobacteriia bacterium]|nr:T9SS type A sorting domain-containing protein [Flavobacteriia bacterium]